MNNASSADSIKYSGQWVLNASAADRCVCFAGTNSPTTGEGTIVASVEFVMNLSVMRDGIPTAAGSDRNTQRNQEARRLNSTEDICDQNPRIASDSHLEAGLWAKISSQYQDLGDNPVVTLNRFQTPIRKPESGRKIHRLLRLKWIQTR